MEVRLSVSVRQEHRWTFSSLADVDETIVAEPGRLLHAIDWGQIASEMVTQAIAEAQLALEQENEEDPDATTV